MFCEYFNWNICSLHVFCDANKKSYAACAYMRSGINENVSVNLAMAKSMHAPLKELTIPRLELMAAVIGVRLGMQVKVYFAVPIPTYYWRDSAVALTWIKMKEEEVSIVFINDRCKEILSYSKSEEWRFVPGIQLIWPVELKL